MASSSSSSGGTVLGGFLQLMFIGLKLTGYINWPWWQVLLPTLIPLGVIVILCLVWLVLCATNAAIIEMQKLRIKRIVMRDKRK
jgi:hypothetical protein